MAELGQSCARMRWMKTEAACIALRDHLMDEHGASLGQRDETQLVDDPQPDGGQLLLGLAGLGEAICFVPTGARPEPSLDRNCGLADA
jgi:hypothetical protein